MYWDWWESLRELGRTHRIRMELMAQFQTQVPHPLADQLLCLLTRGRMADPTVRVLFLIFIGQRRFKGATMQVQCHNIGGGERRLAASG